jgi:hypothetical protein
MKPMKKWISCLGLAVLVAAAGPPAAASLTADQIIDKVKANAKVDQVEFTLRMLLVNKRGEKRERSVTAMKKGIDGQLCYLVRFLYPDDVKGTSLLTIDHPPGEEDDQFIYLPALHRTRRISSSEKSNSFLGTDFSYEDFQARETGEDTHVLVGEENVGGAPCYRIESRSKDPKTATYSKVITWVRKDIFVAVRGEYYDRDGKLLKELNVHKLEKIDGIWTATQAVMTNVQKDHKTLLDIVKVEYHKPLPDELFTRQNLERG